MALRNLEVADPRYLLSKLYNMDARTLLWVMWNITTHFT